MATKKPLPTLIAALTFEIGQADSAVQLLPDGEFRSADGSGRPVDCPCWRIDAEIAAALIAQVATLANPLPIDYEHQTLMVAKNGQPAPASGWFRSIEYRPGQGIYAPVEWTDRARTMIASQEYRYISAVFTYDKTGRVTRILHAALTNTPALDGMDEVQTAALSRLAVSFDQPNPEEDAMLLAKLIAALGLQADATEEQVIAACSAFKTTAADSEAKIAALSAQVSSDPDPAKFVSVEVMRDLQGQVVALSAQVNESKVADLVDVAMSEGKLLPAQEEWARSLGKTSIAALTQFLETAPKVAALGGTQTGGKAPTGNAAADTDAAAIAVCSQLGLSAEEFAKGKL